VAFGDAALGFGKDVNRERALATLGLGHGGDPDIGAGLDIVDRGLLQRHDAPAVGEPHGRFAPIARLERDRLTVDLGDLTAEPDRLLSLSDKGQGREDR
jgi:hypothetical protein